jgi:glycopeptide antibiotics resistance protein
MKSFYQQSIILWVITRAVLIISFGIIILNTNFAQDQQNPLIFAGDLRNIVYFIIHLIILVYEFQSKRKPYLTRAFAGGLSLLLSLGLLFTAVGPAIFFSKSEAPSAIGMLAWIPVAIWVFLFGLYDAMDIQTFAEEENNNQYKP